MENASNQNFWLVAGFVRGMVDSYVEARFNLNSDASLILALLCYLSGKRLTFACNFVTCVLELI